MSINLHVDSDGSLIEFTCNKFNALYQIVKSFNKICPPIINISLIKNRLIFTTNTKDGSQLNQLLYIIYLDNSSTMKITKEHKSFNKTFNLSCTLIKLKPIVINLFKSSQSTIIWAVSCTNSNWNMCFSSSDIKFNLPVEQSQLSSFAFLDNLDTNYLFKIHFPRFELYYNKAKGIFWFNPLLSKMIFSNRSNLNGIFEVIKSDEHLEINSNIFHQVIKFYGVRIQNEKDSYNYCIGMLLNEMLLKYFKKELIHDDWLYMNLVEALDTSKQLTYMIRKNDQGKIESASIHMSTVNNPLRSISELLNQRENKEYLIYLNNKFNKENSLSSITNYMSSYNNNDKSILEKELKILTVNKNIDNIIKISNSNSNNNNNNNNNNKQMSIIHHESQSKKSTKHDEIVKNNNKENDFKQLKKQKEDDSSNEESDSENNNNNNYDNIDIDNNYNPFD